MDDDICQKGPRPYAEPVNCQYDWTYVPWMLREGGANRPVTYNDLGGRMVGVCVWCREEVAPVLKQNDPVPEEDEAAAPEGDGGRLAPVRGPLP